MIYKYVCMYVYIVFIYMYNKLYNIYVCIYTYIGAYIYTMCNVHIRIWIYIIYISHNI